MSSKVALKAVSNIMDYNDVIEGSRQRRILIELMKSTIMILN